MATLTRQDCKETALEATYAAAAGGGDVITNTGGNTILHVKNGSGGNITLTVTAQKTTASNSAFGVLTKSDSVTVVTAGEERFIGPFEPNAFNNSSGQIEITYSGVTSFTIAGINFAFPA